MKANQFKAELQQMAEALENLKETTMKKADSMKKKSVAIAELDDEVFNLDELDEVFSSAKAKPTNKPKSNVKENTMSATITHAPEGVKILKNSQGRFFKDDNGNRFYINQSGKLLKGQEQPVFAKAKKPKAEAAPAKPAKPAAKPAKPAAKPAKPAAKAPKAKAEAADHEFVKLNKKQDDLVYAGTKKIKQQTLADGSVHFAGAVEELTIMACDRGAKTQYFVVLFNSDKAKITVALDTLTTPAKVVAQINEMVANLT